MKFSILKQNIPEEANKIWDVFRLDSYNKTLSLSSEGVKNILDTFNGNLNPSKVRLETMIAEDLFKNMGGNSKTSTSEIAAFFFVLCRTDNFRFSEFVDCISDAIFIDTIYTYFEECKVTVPFQYILSVQTLLSNDFVFKILSKRSSFEVDIKSTEEEYKKFSDELVELVTLYYRGGSQTLDQINDFINN